MFTRRNFLTSAAAAAASGLVKPEALEGMARASGSIPSPQPGGGERPNILIFVPDQQQGATVLPNHPCLTPNIDKFAAQGVLFPNAFCPTAHCCPSRASFHTGVYPSEHGVYNNVYTNTAIHTNPFPGTKFFSQYLHQAGYQMALSGKWHVGRDLTPQDCGWKVIFEYPYDKQYSGKELPGGIAGFDGDDPQIGTAAAATLHHPTPRKPGEIIRPGWGNVQFINTILPGDRNAGPDDFKLSDYRVVNAGVEGMKTLAAAGKPWCLYVSNDGGHDLYAAPKKYVDMYDPKSIELPANFRDTLADKPGIYQRMRYQVFAQLSDDEIRQVIAHYWACLTMEDALFGLLLDQLEKTGQAENTIVIYLSDHGDYAAAHGLWCKGVPSFREAHNVPCVIRWPRGTKNPGRQVDAFVSMTDFAQTFLDAAGIPNAYKTSGNSLLPWLRGETPANWPDASYGQMNGLEVYYTQRTVTTKDYKYVYNAYDNDEMYDLKNDPYEMVNLAYPDVMLARDRVEQGKGLESLADVPWPPLSPTLEEARRDLLKRMWTFATQHNDILSNRYYTNALAPVGPALIL